VTVSPATIRVHLPIEQRVGYKDVAIKGSIRGTVSSGYWVSEISVDPATVTLVGSPDALDRIPGFVEAEAVTVTGARADITKHVGLVLPNGVSMLDGSDVVVHIAIEPVSGGITIPRKVTITDPACDVPVTVSPDTVEVIVSGPLPTLQALTTEDVQIVVDVSSCSPGNFQSKPRAVSVPDSLKVESIVPTTVEVNIKSK
jgi:YbbR domain-containing protein